MTPNPNYIKLREVDLVSISFDPQMCAESYIVGVCLVWYCSDAKGLILQY